jgi:ABC-type transporter lipoprotein component MlaA
MYVLDALEEGSVDFYETIRSTFLQNRQKFESLCAAVQDQETAPSYDFDFDDMSNEDED